MHETKSISSRWTGQRFDARRPKESAHLEQGIFVKLAQTEHFEHEAKQAVKQSCRGRKHSTRFRWHLTLKEPQTVALGLAGGKKACKVTTWQWHLADLLVGDMT
jgi:hypothetical protein